MSIFTKVMQGAADLANAWYVRITDGTNVLGTGTHPVRTDPTGTTTQPVSASSLPLPTGAATESTLSTVNGKVPALVSGRVPVDGSGVTQPVSASSLPLPTGAATETTLAAVKAKTDNIPSLGQAAMASSVPVAIASDQSTIPTKIEDDYGFEVECTPMDELRVTTMVRLVGATFVGTTIDPNFWTSTTGGTTGTNTQANGELTLSSGTNAAGSAIMQTVRRARYIGSASNRYRSQIRLNNTGVADNVRRWGAFDGTDGCYFELDGTTLYAVVLKASTPTRHDITASSPTLTVNNTWEIYYTNGKVYFAVNGDLVHTHVASATSWAATLNLPARMSSINAGSTTDCTIVCRVATIVRFGPLSTETTSCRVTTAGTMICKYGPGRLHRITINNPSGTLISVYDNTAGSGTLIAVINTPAVANPVTLTYDLPFSTGLTVVSTGTWDATVIYE